MRLVPLLLILLASRVLADDNPGHSSHGSAFDSGLRQKPWKMEGIGHSHFPITTKVPEVQEWYDQANTLMHSFWFEEAERSYRWCLKLDPDCAMAYWGLARTGLGWFTRGPLDTPERKRYLDFLAEAVRRKETVSPRERMYIEAWASAFDPDTRDRMKFLSRELQKIAVRFPDDIEARALYALFAIEPSNALGVEEVLRRVFEKEPDHPGAHHYRIHNWDHVDAEQALVSCREYGRVAPNIGHADHMPGHNYTKMGLWHEAGYSMDAATRVELRYMNERMALPYETWNYAHNRNYLCYIQEQLGMAEAALQGARDLIAAPRDPESNKDNTYGAFDQGMVALVRALVKFERWDEILNTTNSTAIPWRDLPSDKLMRGFAETLARVGKGETFDARRRLKEWKGAMAQQGDPAKSPAGEAAILSNAAEGLVCAAEGNFLEAVRFLTAGAAHEKTAREAHEYSDDPPEIPWPIYRLLGDVCFKRGEHRLAAEAYEQSLRLERNDAFALAGLAQARAALGDTEKATAAAGAFLYEWSGADPGLRWSKAVEALGIKTGPVAATLAPERVYRPDAPSTIGPINWQPYNAPQLECTAADGSKVTLDQFKGSNVLLVFYLGDECVHCMEQLTAINAHSSDWSTEETVVIGVSSASPEKNKASPKLGKLGMKLLSDSDHINARRFASYDDFEEIELHSTVLIDKAGRVHWKRTGGKPFADVDFLLKEVRRMNQKQPTQAAVSVPSKP